MRLRLTTKFLLVLGVLAVAIVLLGWVGLRATDRLAHAADGLYADQVKTSQLTSEVGSDLDDAAKTALQLIPTTDIRQVDELNRRLDDEIVPAVVSGITALRRRHASDPQFERERVEQIAGHWRAFQDVRRTGRLNVTGGRNFSVLNARLARRLATIFGRISPLIDQMTDHEVSRVQRATQSAGALHVKARRLVLAIIAAALLGGAGSLFLLIRNIVPRLRAYSRFAADVASGEMSGRLDVRGGDAIADLGHALNDMVGRQQQHQERQDAQGEFTAMTQVTEGEGEAHELLKRHLEREIAGSSVVVLNRNNSENRLEAKTHLPHGSPLNSALANAKPRSCLAVRFAQTHAEREGRVPLVSCEVCHGTPGASTCEPLLVGGQVIGSVLVTSPAPLAETDRGAITRSVAQAAPVLANLRNLAIAELRAATDALTGLPNNRAVQATLKRMVAQASRVIGPLTAVMLDLDHFKEINDRHGHGCGDEVLAAVASVLQATVRESDFVGRYGGEEFLLLLPDTGRDDAKIVAEKVRAAIATIRVATIDRPITASLGCATFPEDAGDAETLSRSADRALYAAKANGRDRVEVHAPADHPPAVTAAADERRRPHVLRQDTSRA
ncbi:MAG TPA: diguanylate cyclase [Baekduia sp.]|nr:diguanylate cyclase [Baekduia sp.]